MLSGLTYNIYYGENLNTIIDWLNSLPKSLDIICFQEFPQSEISYLQRMLRPFPYDFYYAPSFIVKSKVYGELTLMHKNKLRLEAQTIVSLGSNFIEEKVFKTTYTRTALITKLKYKEQSFIVSNTHLIAFASNRQRREQLREVFRQVDLLQEKTRIPVVIVGDMNYTSLLSRTKLFQIVQQFGFVNAFNHNTHTLLGVKNQQLDYIFYKGCTLKNIQIIKKPFSDHLPIEFTIVLSSNDD